MRTQALLTVMAFLLCLPQALRAQVSTTFNGDPVTINASYRTLAPGGPTYVEFGNVSAPAKKLEVQVHNYNF